MTSAPQTALEDGSPNPDYDLDTLFVEDDFTESPTKEQRTAFEDYKALFQSKYIKKGMHFTLRDAYLTQEELFELHQLNPDVQFLYVPFQESFYVSHRFED